ncbi:YSIRK-type signal peptide-containing protein, partial [Streptococcus mitis]|uniref:YSIRK-type signal peptide-containing protein n=1 Tax=Streptococcus mitis TaxID=28037 RepID=UPI0039C4AE0B
MENKSNSLNRIKRHQREKVLRFSIRKYSFGAASVAVAALMFLGARVASADSVIENNSQPTTDVVKKKEKDKPLAELQQPTDIKVEVAQNPSEKKMTTNNENVIKVVDKAKLKKVIEELKTTLSSKSDLDNSVISPIKDRVQKGQVLLDSDTATQKDVDELLSLLESDLTVLSNATKESSKVQETATENKTEIKDNKSISELSEADKTISDKKESLKLSADQLQAAVLELPEHESTKEVFEKANELLGLAQGVIQNTTISPNDVEDMTKRVKRMFNSVKNATLRLTSGKNDPRNGNKIEEGSNVRAASISSRWDSSDNLLIYQRHRASDGSRVIRNGLREYTEKKVDMFAKTTTINGERYVVYDVFFNNDGTAMANLSRYQIYRLILPPQILDLTSEGLYKGNTLRDLKFETYTRNGNSGTLSQNPENFTRTGSYDVNFLKDSTDYGPAWRKLTYFYGLDIRHGNSYNQDMRDTFKGNSNDPLLIHAVTRTESKFNKYSYGFGVKTEDKTSAVHMQVKAKLKAGVTDDQVREAFALAVAGTFGETTNQAYTFISGRDANESKYTDYPDQPVQPTLREKQAKLYPIQGSTHTKVVGDTIPNSGNPVADRYITRKGSGDFPGRMSWSWEGNNSPSTANAGKFTYTAIARYQDGSTSKDANSGSDGRVHFTVNPKKPTITTSVVNKKGLTNQTIEVNVGSGVKNGSVVKLYDGDRVIGQGTSNGTTARITVSGALPGNPLKAETTVDNGGVVVSQKSDPVTPTEAPDTQAPTLAITPANQTVVEGQTVTFTVTARDDKHVNLDANEFLTKYGTRVFSGKASITSPTDTDTEKTRRITITTTAEDVGKTNTITFNATDNANHRATPVTFTFTVTSRDTIAPTITAGDATVTSREQITPISVTAVDNTGGVGMRDNNPIEVTGLPAGLTYANNRITGTPTGAPGNSTVTIKAYDKNGNMGTKTITITVRSQADTHNPTGAGLTVNQNHTITDAELKAKVSNAGPGTLSIVSRPSTATAGNAGNAVVKVTYP